MESILIHGLTLTIVVFKWFTWDRNRKWKGSLTLTIVVFKFVTIFNSISFNMFNFNNSCI